MTAELSKILESKRIARRELASRQLGEKFRILEELTERALATRKDTAASLPNEPWEIPSSWQWRRVGDVARIVGGGTPRTDHFEYFGGDVPWITPADLSGYSHKTISRGSRSITLEGLHNSGAQLLPEGTVLFSSRAPIGYVAIAANPVATNQGFKSFVLGNELESDFVYYYLQRARGLALELASGTTFLEISGKNASRLPIPVPPIIEQQRIVAEIEKQFTRLSASVAMLERVKSNLKRYRAAVLKAACAGALVATDAESQDATDKYESPRSFESGPDLLSRILAEQGAGATQRPRRDRSTGHLEHAPPLPDGWTWAMLGQLCRKITDGEHLSPKTVSDGIFLLSAKDVRGGGVQFDDPKFVSNADSERFRKRCDPEEGDVLVVSRGATIGRVSLVQTNVRFCLMGSVILLKPVAPVSGRFLSICLRDDRARKLLGFISGSTAQQAIYIRDIRVLPIPLPPLAEQHRIVAEVERRLSVLDELERVVEANLLRAKNLRQSILYRAFSGNL